ncbi:hypothetical protein HK405_012716 [Cladochytrium tenue]|nr:hypothetical protein HK405_012716 [Cladochytrium tenue]
MHFQEWLRGIDTYAFLYKHFLNSRGVISRQTSFLRVPGTIAADGQIYDLQGRTAQEAMSASSSLAVDAGAATDAAATPKRRRRAKSGPGMFAWFSHHPRVPAAGARDATASPALDGDGVIYSPATPPSPQQQEPNPLPPPPSSRRRQARRRSRLASSDAAAVAAATGSLAFAKQKPLPLFPPSLNLFGPSSSASAPAVAVAAASSPQPSLPESSPMPSPSALSQSPSPPPHGTFSTPADAGSAAGTAAAASARPRGPLMNRLRPLRSNPLPGPPPSSSPPPPPTSPPTAEITVHYDPNDVYLLVEEGGADLLILAAPDPDPLPDGTIHDLPPATMPPIDGAADG